MSPTGYFIGIDSIYNDFLLDRIRKAYSRIELISEDVSVRVVDETSAIVVFSYSTDCNRRDTDEPFGIAGLETQVYNKVGGEWKITHIHYSANGKAQD